jgi:hypothetical protein
MLVNRDNWYMSPINEWGRTRPELFDTFCRLVGLFDEIDPPSLTKRTNTALLLDPLQKAAQRPGQDILRAFYEADIDHEFYDPNVGDCDKPILFYVGTNWLAAFAQEKLLQYVEGGRHLVCIGTYPRFDDQMRPLNRLGIVEPPGIVDASPEGLRLVIDDAEDVLASAWASNYEQTPGTPIVGKRLPPASLKSEEDQLRAHLQVGSAYTVGYTEVRGQGRLTVIGLAPSPALLRWVHRRFDVTIPVHSSTPAISTALFERDGISYVIAVNSGNETRTADIELVERQVYHVEDLMRGKQDLGTGKLAVHLPRKEGTVLRLTPLKGHD